MRTLLTADWVVGFDKGDHALIRKGEVAFSGGQIDFVGRGFDGPVDRRIDYGRAFSTQGC